MKNNTNEELLFQTSSQIEKIQTLADGGLKLTCVTQELIPDEATKLFSLKGKQGWFLFKEVDIKKDEIDNLDIEDFTPIEKRDKTPSQRLRNSLYVLWEQNGSKGDFEDFYKKQMNKFIDAVKEKLD